MRQLILDSNIFLRHLLQDIPSQSEKTKEIFDQIEKGAKKGLVSILVVNEILWILEKYYELKRNVYIPKLLELFYLEHIKIIEAKKDVVITIMQKMEKQKYDFTDIYLAHVAQGRKIASFDKDFLKIPVEGKK